jgi:hypothetical protein
MIAILSRQKPKMTSFFKKLAMYKRWIKGKNHVISIYFPEQVLSVVKPEEDHPLIGSRSVIKGISQTIAWRLTNDMKKIVIFDITHIRGESHYRIRKMIGLCEESRIEVKRKFLLPGAFPSITPSENDTNKELFIKINIE